MLTLSHHQLLGWRRTEINELYWAISLKTFGVGFVSIFLPIYLYQLGYGVQLIFGYFLMLHVTRLFIEPISGWLVARYGPKHILALSFLVLLVQLGLFLTLPGLRWPLPLISTVAAIALSLHFVSLHTHFSAIKTKRLIGRDVSRLDIFICFAAALGPLLGGIIGTYLGFEYAFLIAILIVFLATLPLFRTKDIEAQGSYNLRRLKLKDIKQDLISEAGAGIDSVLVNFLWPFVIFTIVGTSAQVGAITTVSLLATLLTARITGKLLDRGHWKGLMQVGAWASVGTHLLRLLATTSLAVTGVSMIGDLVHWFVHIPYMSAYYEHADKPWRVEYIVAMEMATEIGRIVFWLCVLLASFISLQLAFSTAFVLGAVGAGLLLRMRDPRAVVRV